MYPGCLETSFSGYTGRRGLLTGVIRLSHFQRFANIYNTQKAAQAEPPSRAVSACDELKQMRHIIILSAFGFLLRDLNEPHSSFEQRLTAKGSLTLYHDVHHGQQ